MWFFCGKFISKNLGEIQAFGPAPEGLYTGMVCPLCGARALLPAGKTAVLGGEEEKAPIVR